jgi:hypothetical protein
MKKFLLAGVAAIALASGAQAADLGVPRGAVAAAVVAPVFSWTGFYVGGQIGYGWLNGSSTFSNGAPTLPVRSSGVFGGVHVGYNYQINNFVLGAEADIEYSGIRGTRTDLTGGTSAGIFDSRWQGSLRARAGVAADRARPAAGVHQHPSRLDPWRRRRVRLHSELDRPCRVPLRQLRLGVRRSGPALSRRGSADLAAHACCPPRRELPVLDRPVGGRRPVLIVPRHRDRTRPPSGGLFRWRAAPGCRGVWPFPYARTLHPGNTCRAPGPIMATRHSLETFPRV